MTSQEKAERLLALHHAADPLIFINAWDVVSARIIESLGFPAIATTSAGIAWTEGFPDGERITREQMLSRLRRITRAVRVPVSADLEGAYGTSEEDAIATARGAIAAGAVGLNFEDATDGTEPLMDIEAQGRRITAMRNAAEESGVHLVINARTDTFLKQVGDSDEWRLSEAVRRGVRYLQAGADCIFVPGVSDVATITALVRNIHGPVNILAGAATPPVTRLQAIGVSRISAGSGAMGHALARFRAAARGVLATGMFDFAADRITNAELNALFAQSS
jgi:2-methylisocitrate lyase-like PEP mutase family enzyme